MIQTAALMPIETRDSATAARRRGACPSLAAPMATGDGLLVRMRPAASGMRPAQLRAIAAAAARFGNGILEVTARGNLQVRGLRADSVLAFSEAIDALDMPLATGTAIETPALSGIDPAERFDPRPLADAIRARLLQHGPALKLAAKLSITVDGGGRFHLGGLVADLRLEAVDAGDLWRLSLAGTAAGARPIAVLPMAAVVEAVMVVLNLLHAKGPAARGRDLDAAALAARFSSYAVEHGFAAAGAAPRPAGLQDFGVGGVVLGVGLPFCQIQAPALIDFLQEVEDLGATEIRLAPDHGLFVLGLSGETALLAQASAAAHGFRISADDPAEAIALCAGSRGCASAFFDSHALADTVIATAPELLDGSLQLHLSGCGKGCAHPAPAALTLAGAPFGYGLVVNGAASGSPAAYIAAKDSLSALARLSALVRGNRNAGETARSCLDRLGAARIAAAMQQE